MGLRIAKQLESKDRTDLNQIMKHKITQTLDLALLLSGEPEAGFLKVQLRLSGT